MKRILHLPGKLHGGVGSVIMNLNRRIDHTKYVFDVCVIEETSYREEIESYGGRVYVIPKRKEIGTAKFIKEIKKIIRDNGYEVVHVHSVFTGIFSLVAAFLAHTKKRIYHAHNTVDSLVSNHPLSFIIIPLFRFLINKMATEKLACGRDAGNYVFGNNNYEILPNGVETEVFRPIDAEQRLKIRKDLGFKENDIVVGNVASFIEVKNQKFFVELAESDKSGRCKFLLVGDGPMLEEMKMIVKEKHLESKIFFLGNRKDINILCNVMDVFCLPSLFEGLPVTAIEAQACGTPVVTTGCVTDEADMKIIPYVRIDSFETSVWIDTFYKLEKTSNRDVDEVKNGLLNKKYDIKMSVNKIVEYYTS